MDTPKTIRLRELVLLKQKILLEFKKDLRELVAEMFANLEDGPGKHSSSSYLVDRSDENTELKPDDEIHPFYEDGGRAAYFRRTKRGELANAVRNVFETLHGEFSFKEVRAGLREHFPEIDRATRHDSSLTHVLRRLETQGEINLVERGRGKRPTVYSRIFSNEIPVDTTVVDQIETTFVEMSESCVTETR